MQKLCQCGPAGSLMGALTNSNAGDGGARLLGADEALVDHEEVESLELVAQSANLERLEVHVEDLHE